MEASLRLIAEYILRYPKHDIKKIVKMDLEEITKGIKEAEAKDSSVDRESVAAMVSGYRKWNSVKRTLLVKHLTSIGVKGLSKYTNAAARWKLAMYDEETRKMGKCDSQPQLFAPESTSMDPCGKLTIPSHPVIQKMLQKMPSAQIKHSSLDVNLDENQLHAISSAMKASITLINAGPGTGKTTTLCHMVKEILIEKQDCKMLFLSFTTKAEEVMTSRMIAMGMEDYLVDRKDCFISQGLCIMTVDKLAYVITKQRYESFDVGKQECCRILSDMPTNDSKMLDYLIVDECQDLSHIEFKIMLNVMKLSSKSVLAGDPKQEIFSDCSYFSNYWCSFDSKGVNYGTKDVKRVHLVNNYRSCSTVVDALNRFTAIHFPNIGGLTKQVSMRGHCEEGKHNTNCIKVIQCGSSDEVGASIVESLSRNGDRTAYVISPMSVHAYNNDQVTLSMRTHFEMRREKGDNIDAISNRGPNLQEPQTAMSLKGGEADLVCMFGLDVQYNTSHYTNNRQLKLMYVALSRAKDGIHVFMNYYTSNPSFLHIAMEGSILKARFSLKPKVVPFMIGNKSLALGLQRELQIGISCNGINKENSGGLCTKDIEVTMEPEWNLNFSIDLNPASSTNDAISHHVLSKVLICAGLRYWTQSMVIDPASSVDMDLVSIVVKYMEDNYAAMHIPPRDAVNLTACAKKHNRASLSASVKEYTFALLQCLMHTINFLRGWLPEWHPPTIDPSEMQTMPLKNASMVIREAKVSHEAIGIRHTVALPHIMYNSASLAAAFGSAYGNVDIFNLHASIDVVLDVELNDSSGTHTISLPIIICSKGGSIKPHLVKKASLCAAMLGCTHGIVLNTCTGGIVAVKAADMNEVEYLAKVEMLSSEMCRRGPHVCLTASVSLLADAHIIVMVQSRILNKLHDGAGELAVILLNKYCVETVKLFPCSLSESNFYSEVDACSWLKGKVRHGAVLIVYCDAVARKVMESSKHFSDLKDNVQCTLGDLFASIATGLSVQPNLTRLIECKGQNDFLSLMTAHREDTLDWCVELLFLMGISCKSKFMHGGIDEAMAAVCVLKALLNWDTRV